MNRKQLRRISVATTPEAEDAVSELLGAVLGQPVSSYFNLETGMSEVTAYCRRKLAWPGGIRGEIAAGLMQIKKCGLKIAPGKVTLAKVRRKDWAESWKRHFKPIEIKFKNRRDELRASQKSGRRGTPPSEGKSLLIKPGWSKRRARKNQAVVVLDPGLSFGTGQHPTTAFCLGEIVKQCSRAGGQSFLDLGTGSGILAIAAAKLGYSPVRALDYDPEAVRGARANARANRVQQKLKITRGDVTKLPVPGRRRYDLVCANLTSNLLVTERRRIAGQLNRGGTLVLAGILNAEFAQVLKAFEALGLKLVSSRTEKEWRSGTFRGVT